MAVKPHTEYQLSARVYKSDRNWIAVLATNGAAENLTLQVDEGSDIGQWTYLKGTWNSGDNNTITLRCFTRGNATGSVWFDEISFVEVTQKPQLRNTRIITPQFPTEDVVIADFVVTDTPYFADNSGANDATLAIQKALEDCYRIGGGTVWIPAGSYQVTKTITIPSLCTLRGDERDPIPLLGKSLRADPCLRKYRFAADCVELIGTREDLKLLDVPLEHAIERVDPDRIKEGVAFAVRRRTLE